MLWGVQWRSKNRLDGERTHLVHNDLCLPMLFRTRQKARRYISDRYGYIKNRPDLQNEPHGWKMPIPVKVRVTLEEQ